MIQYPKDQQLEELLAMLEKFREYIALRDQLADVNVRICRAKESKWSSTAMQMEKLEPEREGIRKQLREFKFSDTFIEWDVEQMIKYLRQQRGDLALKYLEQEAK